jgi:hypothetical protein
MVARMSGTVPMEEGRRARRASLNWPTRAAFVLAGAGLLIGFFLPWVKLGALVSVSGFGLVFAEGDVVSMISGSNRFLLFAIPLLAVTLMVLGVLGQKAASWVGATGGVAVLGYAVYTVLSLFLASTGIGMWLVAASTLVALSLGFIDLGRRSAQK